MYLLSVQNFLKNIFHWFKRKCVKNYESSAKILENFLMSQDVMRHKLVEMIIIILINIIFFFLYFHWNIMNLEKKKENLIKWDFIWHKYSYFLKAICMIRKIHNHIIPYFLKKKFSRRKILKNLKSWFKSWRYSIFERNFKQFKNVFHLLRYTKSSNFSLLDSIFIIDEIPIHMEIYCYSHKYIKKK